jgi:hypothetical protein
MKREKMNELKFRKKLAKLLVKAEKATERATAQKILSKAKRLYKKHHGG